MRKWVFKLLTFIILFFLVGCTLQVKQQLDDSQHTDNAEINQDNDSLKEDKRVYQNDDPNSLVHLYVTVLNQEEIGNESVSFYDLNRWYDNHSIKSESPVLDVIIQEGDENGPKKGNLGYGDKSTNATINIRGNSSRDDVQKSYKIKLNDSLGLWKGQKVINLNKHIDDLSRVKNKLTFDYFKMLPSLPSLRTQFVQLHIKDLSTNSSENKYISYGLYTHVEQVNERYLNSHGLNSYGQLYKAINFEFYYDEKKLKTEDSPEFDKKMFETLLEIKGDNDHSKLINMLKDLNNPNNNINDLIKRYFDKDNYLTWLAVNIIFGNIDTMSTNYYLYSPPSSEKWYFIPWDYDKAWGWHLDKFRNIPNWQNSIARYWGNVLHKRFLKDPNNLMALNEKIEELSSIITEKQTKNLLDGYLPIVKPIINQAPDKTFFPININEYDKKYTQLINQPETNRKIYYEHLEYPMPIFLGEAKFINQNYVFNWEHSYHLRGDNLFYTFQLSKTVDFSNIILEHKDLLTTSTTVKKLEKGKYFWRVVIKDSKGNQQIPFDKYKDKDGLIYWGLKELIIN